LSAVFERLKQGKVALWLEVAPPRGVNAEPLLKRLSVLAGHVDAINLTDNALGRVKMSGLVFGAMIKARLGIPVVLNLSCRDRNRFALKSDLLGASALGLDAVVALTGDKIPTDDPGGARAVHDLNAFGAGAVANPNRKNFEREADLRRRKAAAGASFVITQPVFDLDTARRFLKLSDGLSLKTVLGILPVKREAMANYLKERVTDLSGAAGHFDEFSGMADEEVRRKSLGDNLALMKALAREVAGFNIMSGGGPSLAIELALEFSRWRMESVG
jgi:methylenetetrahydrofolate reductase (NADPH)